MPVELLVLLIEYCVGCLTCPTTGGMCCHLDVLFCQLLDLPHYWWNVLSLGCIVLSVA